MKARSLLVVPVLVVAGCGGEYRVPAGKVEGAIRSLPYEVRFRDVEQPSNLKAFAGRLRDPRTNTSIDFSVVVGEGSGDVPIVPGASASSWGRCAGAGVTTSSSAGARHAATRDRMESMRVDLEDAIFGLASEAYCEG
jgi:hypothetical protein